jgi:hypothetical protein
LVSGNARYGNLELPLYFLKAKQGYTARKKIKTIDGYSSLYSDNSSMKFSNKNKFRYGIPACTGQFLAPVLGTEGMVVWNVLIWLRIGADVGIF